MSHASRIAEQLAIADEYRCNECGGHLRSEGNCKTCEECGWSKCGGERP